MCVYLVSGIVLLVMGIYGIRKSRGDVLLVLLFLILLALGGVILRYSLGG